MTAVAGRALVVGAVLLLALASAGCVRIPATGRVVPGSEIEAAAQGPPLRVLAQGPAEGAGPLEIVEGFLTAASTLEEVETAREFLTPAAQDRWRPNVESRIHATAADIVVGEPADGRIEVSVSAELEATVDSSGRYRETAEPVDHVDPLELAQIDGEWRIASLPSGVLVRRLDADRVLEPYPVFFVDPPGEYLVPDVRWFPQRTSSAVSVVRALLAGPSAPLLQSVRSGAPEGTALALNSVPVDDGIATVALTDDVLEATPEERALLLLQVQESLRGVPGVAAVRLVVDGRELEIPDPADVSSGEPVLVEAEVDPRPVVLADPASVRSASSQEPGLGAVPTVASTAEGVAASRPTGEPPADAVEAGTAPLAPLAPGGAVIARLEPDGLVAVGGLDDLAAQIRTGLAVGPGGTRYAGLDAARQSLVVQTPGAPATEALRGRALTTPSIDRWGWVWTASHPEGERPVVQAYLSSPVEVEVPDTEPGDRIRALRVSREGARALLVLDTANGESEVLLAGVVRDASGEPRRLSVARAAVAVGLVGAVDAAWVRVDQVVVLGRRSPSEELRPVLAQVGGPSEALGPTPAAVGVTSGAGERRVVVATEGGIVLTRSGRQWVDTAPGVSPAFEG